MPLRISLRNEGLAEQLLPHWKRVGNIRIGPATFRTGRQIAACPANFGEWKLRGEFPGGTLSLFTWGKARKARKSSYRGVTTEGRLACN